MTLVCDSCPDADCRWLALENPFDLERDFLDAERFGPVVLNAEFKCRNLFVLLGPRRKADKGNLGQVRVVLQRRKKLAAIHLGHHQVGDDQRRRVLLDDIECLQPVVGRHDLAAERLDDLFKDHQHVGFVVHQDDEAIGEVVRVLVLEPACIRLRHPGGFGPLHPFLAALLNHFAQLFAVIGVFFPKTRQHFEKAHSGFGLLLGKVESDDLPGILVSPVKLPCLEVNVDDVLENGGALGRLNHPLHLAVEDQRQFVLFAAPVGIRQAQEVTHRGFEVATFLICFGQPLQGINIVGIFADSIGELLDFPSKFHLVELAGNLFPNVFEKFHSSSRLHRNGQCSAVP